MERTPTLQKSWERLMVLPSNSNEKTRTGWRQVENWFSGKIVAVLGGLGFIGSSAALKTAELGAEVRVVDSLKEGFGGNQANVPKLTPRCDIYQLDVRSRELETVLSGVDVVINTVGQVSHQRSIEDPLGDLEANCEAQVHILECCRRTAPASIVVYAGTRQVYGRTDALPITESVPTRPVDINGVDKFAGEEYHRIYNEVHGLRTVRLRLTNTYGPRQSLITADQGVIPTYIRRALEGNSLQIYGSGTQRRDVTHVEDVTKALLAVAATSEAYGEVFNLGSDRPVSIRDIAMVISSHTGVEVDFMNYPDQLRPIAIGDTWSSYDRLELVTGWRPQITLNDGMSQTLDFYRNNPEYWRSD